jgi:hypothetical protein
MASNELSESELARLLFSAKAAAYVSPMTIKAWQEEGRSDFFLVDARKRHPEPAKRIAGAFWLPEPEMVDRAEEQTYCPLLLGYLVQFGDLGCANSDRAWFAREGTLRWYRRLGDSANAGTSDAARLNRANSQCNARCCAIAISDPLRYSSQPQRFHRPLLTAIGV